MKFPSLFAVLYLLCLPAEAAPAPTVARVWDEEILSAIRIDLPNPPVHARNLFHLSVAMYDAWAAYDPTAVGYLYHAKVQASDLAAARREAVSYAAYRLLSERYALSTNSARSLAALDARMVALKLDTNNVSFDPSTPAGVGNSIAAAVSAYFLNDGARQIQRYKDLPADAGGYVSVNPPLLTQASGTLAKNVNRWQPLAFTNAVSQNNIPVDLIQKFVGAQWLGVRPFALERKTSTQPWFDPGPPPQLDAVTGEVFRTNVVDVIRRSGELTPDDGVSIDISPASFGNNTLGSNDGSGYAQNPVTKQPYSPNVVKRGDFARVLAEFWADGPASETPPGHWNVIANVVSDSPGFEKRLGGTGPVLDDLEWDVKVYFALNAAVHDAACAAWSLKRVYDGWRPIEAIRYMGERGQSSNPADPTYDPQGLPLVPGLIEIVTSTSAQPNGRHAGLPVGGIAILTWPGAPADPTTQHSGTRWILAADWLPYQKKTFVTPAFPGYISGHSTFSRAAAEVLAAITGSPYFPGGLGTFTASAGKFLSFEKGPTQDIQLQWASYFDAADQAGLSRLWGGIHVPVDDLMGRRIGALCGRGVWALVRTYFDGSVLQEPLALSIRRLDSGECELRYNTIRGLTYDLQFASGINQPFRSLATGPFQATDTLTLRTDPPLGLQGFYRLIRDPQP